MLLYYVCYVPRLGAALPGDRKGRPYITPSGILLCYAPVLLAWGLTVASLFIVLSSLLYIMWLLR